MCIYIPAVTNNRNKEKKMNLNKVIMAILLTLSLQVESKMIEFLDANGNLKCEIDSAGHFEILDGPCFPGLVSHRKEFFCQSESGEEIQVIKEIHRINNYTVKAFGLEYFGAKGSGPGITNDLVVNSISEIEHKEPVSLVFKSSWLGAPISLAIYINGKGGPLIEQLTCQAPN